MQILREGSLHLLLLVLADLEGTDDSGIRVVSPQKQVTPVAKVITGSAQSVFPRFDHRLHVVKGGLSIDALLGDPNLDLMCFRYFYQLVGTLQHEIELVSERYMK